MLDKQTVKVTDEEAAKISATEAELLKAQRDLGALREDFLSVESQILNRLGQLRNTMQETVLEIGKKYDLNVDSSANDYWRYDLVAKMFVRFQAEYKGENV